MYKIVTPESEADAAYADYEYMLGWFDFQGNWQQRLFTNWDNTQKFDNEVFNNKSNIGSILKDEMKMVSLMVNDASIADIKVYMSMFRCEQVWRIFKDGSTEAVAVDSNSIKYNQRGIRFSFEFDLQHEINN